jgi:hypothetical protein
MRRHPPRTYNEITRRTVPDPDSGFRAPMSEPIPRDASIAERVEDLIASLNQAIGFEVSGRSVKLRGMVADNATSARIERAIAALEGVDEVENYLRVA